MKSQINTFEARVIMIRTSCLAVAMFLALLFSGDAHAQRSQIELDRDGGTIVLEPYAPNH